MLKIIHAHTVGTQGKKCEEKSGHIKDMVSLDSFRPWVFIFFLFSLALFLFTLKAPEKDPDEGHYLRLGQQIISEQRLSVSDSLSWSSSVETFPVRNWLQAVCLYELHAAGDVALRIFVLFLVALGAVWVFRCGDLDTKQSNPGGFCLEAQMAMLVVWLALTAPFWTVSAPLWDMLFFPICFFYLFRSAPGDHGRVMLAALFWANASNNYLLWPIVVLMTGVGTWFDGDRKLAKKLFLLAVGCFVLSGATPAGFDYYSLLRAAFSSENLYLRYVTGWESPNFHDFPWYAACLVLVLGAIGFSRQVIPWKMLLPFVSVVALVLLSFRYHVYFSLFAAFFLGCFVNTLFPSEDAGDQRRLKLREQLFFVGLSGICLLHVFFQQAQQNSDWAQASQVLAQVRHGLAAQGQEMRLFNDIRFADPLVKIGEQVFISRQAEIFTQEAQEQTLTGGVLGDYTAMAKLQANWKKVLSHWKINVAVLPDTSFLMGPLIDGQGWKIEQFIPFSQPTPVRPNAMKGIMVLVRR